MAEVNDAKPSLTLYKFRSLDDWEAFGRAKKILERKMFWCDRIWALNDPMEGVYRSQFTEEEVERMFKNKEGTVICSLSAQKAFKLPTMWGHYANGFRGIAIEVQTVDANVHMVHYEPDITSFVDYINRNNFPHVRKILTTKLDCWTSEEEYRFIRQSDKPGYFSIGEITGVYFGLPYSNVGNHAPIRKASDKLQDYYDRVRELYDVAKRENIDRFKVKIVGNEVQSKKFSDACLENLCHRVRE